MVAEWQKLSAKVFETQCEQNLGAQNLSPSDQDFLLFRFFRNVFEIELFEPILEVEWVKTRDQRLGLKGSGRKFEFYGLRKWLWLGSAHFYRVQFIFWLRPYRGLVCNFIKNSGEKFFYKLCSAQWKLMSWQFKTMVQLNIWKSWGSFGLNFVSSSLTRASFHLLPISRLLIHQVTDNEMRRNEMKRNEWMGETNTFNISLIFILTMDQSFEKILQHNLSWTLEHKPSRQHKFKDYTALMFLICSFLTVDTLQRSELKTAELKVQWQESSFWSGYVNPHNSTQIHSNLAVPTSCSLLLCLCLCLLWLVALNKVPAALITL